MSKKIAILTSGGDAPGMNSAIRAVAKFAKLHNIEPFIVEQGYKGLYENNIYSASNIDFDQYANKGGTFIFSSRFPEFKEESFRLKAKENLVKKGIDSLVVIGGDGTYQGAQLLHQLGIKTIALPGTIDNDISSTDFTIGYSTALKSIVDNVTRLKDTMNSHGRTAIVEIMGHGCGDLALFGGIASNAEIIITNEVKLSVEQIGQKIKEQYQMGKRSVIILVSEFIFDDLNQVAQELSKLTNKIVKPVVLSHTQRGGNPTVEEKILATQLGIKAVELISEGKSGLALGKLQGEIKAIPILKALEIPRADRKELTKKINSLNQL